ncbi:MAG: T9SS type A sorting domain-containing protein [Flavobacteriales bacterium]|nr:T9SS type A sorting domain-containing protein [Flavobacteriales bacterium]
MRSILSVLLVLNVGNMDAQLFMRAYAPEEATFYPPNYYAYGSDAALRPNGYVFTNFHGIVCDINNDGEPVACSRLRRTSSYASTDLYLNDVATLGNDVFYHASLGADTLVVLRSNGTSSIVWQAAVPGPSQVAQVLPAGDGGCALLYTFGPYQRAAVARYSATGTVLWRKTYRLVGNNTLFRARSMASTSDGGLLLCGKMTANGTSSAFVLRLDSNGNVNWAREIAPNNGGNAEGMALTELPGGNIRLAVLLPQPGMYLGMIDMTASGAMVGSWGYTGASFSVGSIHFGPDGSAYGTGGNGAEVFRLAPDGSTVFAVTQEGPPGTYMLCEALLPKPDGTQVMLGNYSTNPFTNTITTLYVSGPLGTLPAPFSAPYSFTTAAYTPTLSPINPSDSTLTAQLNVQLTFESTELWKDTLFATPNSVADRPLAPFDLRMQPNPATDHLTIGTDTDTEFRSLQVLDLSGARVLSIQGKLPSPYTINLAQLSSGAYVLQVESPRGRVSRSFLKN